MCQNQINIIKKDMKLVEDFDKSILGVTPMIESTPKDKVLSPFKIRPYPIFRAWESRQGVSSRVK